jgi:hypothetical protein
MSNSRRKTSAPCGNPHRQNIAALAAISSCLTDPFLSLTPGHAQRFKALVEADGIEPTTPCLQSRCSPTELRPRLSRQRRRRPPDRSLASVVGPGRFELPTSRLSSARSNQLSYEPGSVDPPSTRPPQQGQTRAWLSFRIGKGCAGGGTGFDELEGQVLQVHPEARALERDIRHRLAFGSCTHRPLVFEQASGNMSVANEPHP